jgi:hypothetical protein
LQVLVVVYDDAGTSAAKRCAIAAPIPRDEPVTPSRGVDMIVRQYLIR